MTLQDNSRRELLKVGSAALATSAISWNASSYGAILGSNERVRVSVVGAGDRMLGGDIPAFVEHQEEMNFELVAVSDIWKVARERGAAAIETKSGSKVETVRKDHILQEIGITGITPSLRVQLKAGRAVAYVQRQGLRYGF